MKLRKIDIQKMDTRDLAKEHARIIYLGETKSANEIPAYYGRQILWLEDELHKRLISAVGHDFYPPGY